MAARAPTNPSTLLHDHQALREHKALVERVDEIDRLGDSAAKLLEQLVRSTALVIERTRTCAGNTAYFSARYEEVQRKLDHALYTSEKQSRGLAKANDRMEKLTEEVMELKASNRQLVKAAQSSEERLKEVEQRLSEVLERLGPLPAPATPSIPHGTSSPTGLEASPRTLVACSPSVAKHARNQQKTQNPAEGQRKSTVSGVREAKQKPKRKIEQIGDMDGSDSEKESHNPTESSNPHLSKPQDAKKPSTAKKQNNAGISSSSHHNLRSSTKRNTAKDNEKTAQEDSNQNTEAGISRKRRQITQPADSETFSSSSSKIA